MRRGKAIVEQVTSEGEIVLWSDQYFSTKKEKQEFIQKYFHMLNKDNFLVQKNGKTYGLYVKNVTYLGYPHPIYKKRIQIGDNFLKIYAENMKNGIETLLIGLYIYEDTVLFVDFDTTNYVNNKLHNSSAHVYTYDLQRAVVSGYTQKTDERNNVITIFRPDNIELFWKQKTNKNCIESEDAKLVKFFEDFASSIKKTTWNGIDILDELYKRDWHGGGGKHEWPGAYFELCMHDFLEQNKQYGSFVKYGANKKNGEIDLDLTFLELNCFGDLKAHTITEKAIPGNKTENVLAALERGPVYIICCEHETIKDHDVGEYSTTKYWNQLEGKANLMSYHTRMKREVVLKDIIILKIDEYNKRHLDSFQKNFVNSNGKKRGEKVMIKRKDLDYFIYKRIEF